MDDIWDYIDKHLKAGDMVSTGSFFGNGSDKDTNDIGVPYRHAFTVNGAVKLSDGTKLIRIRNPWGSELFHGDWSDSSTKWTEKLKEDAGYVDKDDGLWFITPSDYIKSFENTTYNKSI